MKKILILLVAYVSCILASVTAQQPSSNADIVGIGIDAEGTEYGGPCPVRVHFKATVYLTHVPVKVRYYWERNSGVRTKTQSAVISADSAPKLNVKTDWPVGVAGKEFRATVRLHVLADAGEVVSDLTESTGQCRP